MANDPRYMSFDHQYVETVTVTDATNLAAGIEGHRFIKRDGAYPVAGGYAAGINVYRIYGQGELNANGYQVDDGSTLVYEGQLNPSTTPYKPGVFPYQGLASIVTSGIVIVEVDAAAAAFGVDDAVYATTAGQYIRVKLGNEAGA